MPGTISKKRLFQEIGLSAEKGMGADGSAVVSALFERETLGPTSVGHGVALPHARIEGLDRVQGLFIKLEKGMDFGAVDGRPVDLVFALIGPMDGSSEHLKALALVSRNLRDASLREKLRANDSPSTLHAVLTEVAQSQAA